MYRLAVKYYAGGEVRVTTSLFSVRSPISDTEGEGEGSPPPPPLSPLLDYSAQLDKSVRARISGHGELPVRVTKFRNEAKRSIQRCARALDGVVDTPNDILFLTGTLPGTGADQYLAMAQWSSYIVHGLKNWIGNYVPGKLDFYCWELQKRGALHLHYAVHCPDEENSAFILENFKAQWLRLLDTVSERSGVDLYLNQVRGFSHKDAKEAVQAKAERVIKGVGNYLGKYLSKSSQGTNPWGTFCPCRWWGVSRPLRNIEKSERWERQAIFTSSSQWHALYEECVGWVAKIGDSVFEWKNQVMPGKGAVIYGASKESVISLMKIAMGRTMERFTPRQQLAQSWMVLKEALINVEMAHPNWFGSMTRHVKVMRMWPEIQNWNFDSLGSPQSVSTLQSVTANLKMLLMDGTRINVESPRHGWVSIMLHGCNEVQDALNRVYLDEYSLATAEDFYSLHTGN